MYVSRHDTRVDDVGEGDLMGQHEAMHAAMRSATGFRWAMLLRSTEDPAQLASIEMWQTPEQAQAFRESKAANASLVAQNDGL